MDEILRRELEAGMGSLTGTYSPEQRAEIQDKFVEMTSFMQWMNENYHLVPPTFTTRFNSAACGVLRNAGYDVKLDPGEIPS